MKLKPIQCLLVIYVVPLLMATDCGNCNCGDYREYNVVYKGVDFSVWDTSKFQDKEVAGEVSKNAFGIKIYMKYDQNGIALSQKPNHTSYASFGIAYAWSCSLLPPNTIFQIP